MFWVTINNKRKLHLDLELTINDQRKLLFWLTVPNYAVYLPTHTKSFVQTPSVQSESTTHSKCKRLERFVAIQLPFLVSKISREKKSELFSRNIVQQESSYFVTLFQKIIALIILI